MKEKRVLLVDDDPSVLSGLQRILRREPFQVLTAQSGEHALEILKTTKIDAVVADYNMPSMNGTEFLNRVLEHHPETVRFMLTGNATLEVAVQAINDGAISHFFTKPCDPGEFSFTLRNALQKKELMAEAWHLAQKVRTQSTLLKDLEHSYPGITQIQRSSDGAVVLNEEPPQNFEAFMDELRRSMGE